MRPLALAVLALAACWPRECAPIRWALGAVGGAALVAATWHASFEGRDQLWAAALAVLFGALATATLPRLPESVTALGIAWSGWRWVMLGGAAAAVYGCVPETDQLRDVAVVLAAGAVAEWVRGVPLPAPAFAAAWGLVAWSALFGATGRPSALIGGLFALVAPLAAGAAAAARRGDLAIVGVGLAWAVVALVVARTGGIAMTTPPAWTAAAVGAAVAGGVSALFWRRGRPRPSGA
ncbi:MAG: hypothetical protein ABMA25_13030 [Ilumatobacteraceae bacterium]